MATCTACGAPIPESARFCPTCGEPVATRPDQRERKLATVVFADLVGSTELGGSMDPERTRAMLERFYDAMAAEIETAGGIVEKFAGDAVMSVFGAPASLEDHDERVLGPRRLIAWLNGLVALGRRDEIEKDVPVLLKPGTYLEPFAIRSLGYAREDDALIEQAVRRFEAMGLDWHAAETRRLVGLRRR